VGKLPTLHTDTVKITTIIGGPPTIVPDGSTPHVAHSATWIHHSAYSHTFDKTNYKLQY